MTKESLRNYIERNLSYAKGVPGCYHTINSFFMQSFGAVMYFISNAIEMEPEINEMWTNEYYPQFAQLLQGAA